MKKGKRMTATEVRLNCERTKLTAGVRKEVAAVIEPMIMRQVIKWATDIMVTEFFIRNPELLKWKDKKSEKAGLSALRARLKILKKLMKAIKSENKSLTT